MNNSRGERPIEALLRPYKTVALVEATGVARQAVAGWRTGRSVPDVRALPRLAEFLKVDLGELTAIVADELYRRDSDSANRSAVA